MRRFDECDEQGVAVGCQLTGWWDFPGGGYKHWLEGGKQRVRIDKTAVPKAKRGGDAGIERSIRVKPGEVYRLTAKARLLEAKGDVKVRGNLSARKATGGQIREFNAQPIEESAEKPSKLEVEAEMPPGTDHLTVRIKVHTSKKGDVCEAEIAAMKLERIR